MTGESILFWVLAPLAVAASVAMLFMKKAVHSAILLAWVMITLAIFYIALEAPFLGIVQIVVYTGAVMMLFLFILMLVGVDSSDSLVEKIKGIRAVAIFTVLGFAGALTSLIARADLGREPVGLSTANQDGNVEGLAALLFGDYVWAFEVISALLITAALGAMVLAHSEKSDVARNSQRARSIARFRGKSIATAAGLPGSGVYARNNSVDLPALLPDGKPSDLSIAEVLHRRGDVQETKSYALDGLPQIDEEGKK
ncbi:MAG: NADH-quinone oxidoreductase subunit J [Candidatus Nanopelagicaceae bacterium]|nr:NADH-quinone oxidoreductase subunit J [Candidatus Nanopelagicaceae bacterium]